ncbi:MAG TPA: phage holin family protein [Acidimicrobiales bacterium]
MRVKAVEVQDPADATTRSLGDVFGDLSAELHRMVRAELTAAKDELRADAPTTGRATLLLGGAALAAAAAVLFVALALTVALAEVMPLGVALLVVGVAFGLGAWLLHRRREAELHPAPEPVHEPVDGNDY